MGLLDKVKSQAVTASATASAMAKDAAQKGQAKLDALQAKRTADALLHDLGAVVYAQRTGRGSSTSDADASRLVETLSAHEREHGPIDLGPSGAGAGTPGSASASS